MVMVLTFLAVSIITFESANSDPQTIVLDKGCNQYTPNNVTEFYSKLNASFADLRNQISKDNQQFDTAQRVWTSDTVYAMVQCRNYLSTADCVSCLNTAVPQIRECYSFEGAHVTYDGCFLRREASSFYDQTVLLPGNNQKAQTEGKQLFLELELLLALAFSYLYLLYCYVAAAAAASSASTSCCCRRSSFSPPAAAAAAAPSVASPLLPDLPFFSSVLTSRCRCCRAVGFLAVVFFAGRRCCFFAGCGFFAVALAVAAGCSSASVHLIASTIHQSLPPPPAALLAIRTYQDLLGQLVSYEVLLHAQQPVLQPTAMLVQSAPSPTSPQSSRAGCLQPSGRRNQFSGRGGGPRGYTPPAQGERVSFAAS
ncbi:OLC1v1015696C1 [Oldenlandia corymbosa var. corymbosa]|uniref:OLC1v1015696C1 n=1 Tax=Oldenlandia corymbosa var. corymbosa TaxID=529605 RepID=A0AAV1E6S3_OLDCO|nr:OLC1v1015696C1 [Oldenlandia corymbosa var. corymbosa]